MRCRLAMIGLVALTPVAALVGWWLMPEPRISEAACERIHYGMSVADVEAILGTGVEYETLMDIQGEIDESKYHGAKVWEDGGHSILVTFVNGQVTGKRFNGSTLWQRIGDWYYGRTRYPDGSVAKRLEAAA
jgi:hypothetical protein